MSPLAATRLDGTKRLSAWRLCRAACGGLLALLLAQAPAFAQLVQLAPSAAVDCLTPAAAERGEPEYPLMLLKQGQRGRVVASATFKSTDWLPGPSIKIEKQEGDDLFVAAVKEHLRKLRVPCLPAGAQATLVFDFVFDPATARAHWADPADEADIARRAKLACIENKASGPRPAYPPVALQMGQQGRVWARVRFVAPDQPPEFELYHRQSAASLAKAVHNWMKTQRMPCHEAAPIDAFQQFTFVIEGEVFGFKPITLLQWMSWVKDIQQQRIAFDTETMGCPFDLRVIYLQPQLRNRVAELGNTHPARRPLLDWLASNTLNASGTTLDSIYADSALITVPCVKINLKPKESNS